MRTKRIVRNKYQLTVKQGSMNKIIPAGAGIVIITAIIAGNFLWEEQTNVYQIDSATITQQDLESMVANWMENPDKDDKNQRLEIMKAYYTFEETGQKLTQDRAGLTLMNQIRKMVSVDISKSDLDQLKEDVHKLSGNKMKEECSIQCLVYDPVCGEDNITYACGVEDAACHNVKVKYAGECNKSSETKIMYVDSKLVNCVGVGPQQCMLVKDSIDSDWQMFYNKIEGFDFQEGTQYKLEVLITDVENPPADSSSLKYTLIEILESEN